MISTDKSAKNWETKLWIFLETLRQSSGELGVFGGGKYEWQAENGDLQIERTVQLEMNSNPSSVPSLD